MMLQLLHLLIQVLQPVLAPICCLVAWTLVFLVSWDLWTATKSGVKAVKQLHQIPCANCQFFTGNYYLKCTVHPSRALSEEAIGCTDYWSKERRV